MKHLGRTPNINHTDHGLIVRLEYLPRERIDSKHCRWYVEICQGRSILLYRPGVGAFHRAPDGIRRNPVNRDMLVLARQSDWDQQRSVIRGVQQEIDEGDPDDDDPPLYQFEGSKEEQELKEYLASRPASKKLKDEDEELVQDHPPVPKAAPKAKPKAKVAPVKESAKALHEDE